MAQRGSPDLPEPGVRHMALEVRSVLRAETRTHHVLRSRLLILVVATLVLDAIGTGLMFAFEHGHQASGFDDVGGAWFWVTAQLTTVSSQMPNPVTTPGRLLDIVLELWAITAVATVAGALGAFFTARHHEITGARDRATEQR